MSARRLLVCVAALLAVLVAAPVLADAEPGAGRGPGGLSVLGPSLVSPEQIAEWYASTGHTPRTSISIVELARIYVEEGDRENVRGDVAFVQSVLETGWFALPDHGQVRPEDHNYSGIGAYDNGARGFAYAQPRDGVRAQMQLLRSYADPTAGARPGLLVRSPRSHWGRAPRWELMGGGNWATDPGYASKVLALYRDLLESAGVAPDLAARLPSAPGGGARVPLPPPEPPAPTLTAGTGAWLLTADGQVSDLGDARFFGSLARRSLSSGVGAIAATPTGHGYWLSTTGGDVMTFGDAEHHGAAVALPRAAGIVAMAGTPTGQGYWQVAADGAVYAFGDAHDWGRPAALAAPVAGFSRSPSGLGYWLVTTAGQVLAFGDAPNLGSLPSPPAAPVVGLAPTPTGGGYRIVTATGQLTSFGDARLLPGRAGAPATGVIGIATTPSGAGYWLVTADGRMVGFGDVPSLAVDPVPLTPVVAFSTR